MENPDRIAKLFSSCNENNRAAFVGYICACDPDFDTSLKVCRNLLDSGVDLQRLLHSKSLNGKDRYIAIDGVDNLDARKSSLLKKFLSSLPTTTKVLLTAQNEHNVSNHILQLQPRIKRIKGSRSK